MDLLPSGNNEIYNEEVSQDLETLKSNKEILSVETEDIIFVMKGENFGTTNSDIIYIDTFGKSSEIECDRKVYLKEYSNYEIIIKSKNDKKIEFYHENINIRNKITPITKKSKDISGIINFKGDIGFTDILIKVDGQNEIKCRLEVYPSKIDYKEDYEAILRDVNEEIYNLAYGFLGRTYLAADINNTYNNVDTEFYSILNYIFDKFIKAVDIVLYNPYHELIKVNTVVKHNEIKKVTKETIKWLEKRPDLIRKINGKYIPNEALKTKKYISTDTKENRFIKFILINIRNKIDKFILKYLKNPKSNFKEEKNSDNLLVKKLKYFNREINRKLNSDILRNIKSEYREVSHSLVFTMASGYKEVYKYYLMLQRGLNIESNIFSLSIKELSLLYEYWCFIKIGSLLKKKYNLVSSDFLQVNRNGIFVTLKKGKEASLTYEHPITKEKFTIYYNSKRKSETVLQTPDNILKLDKQGSSRAYEFIFDAKYKIDTTDAYIERYGSAGPKEEDINTMHRYRDAILYSKKSSEIEIKHSIFGAFVLFPYNNEELYKNNAFYKSIDKVNIGGIPFLPSTTKLMEEFLDEIINESSYSNFERSIEAIGKDDYLKEEYFNNRNVLVGNLKSKEQLEINLQKNFYYIPKKNINLINNNINFIALYQSKTTFGDASGIKYYGKIKEIKEVKRSQIIEIKKNSEEIYYRFEIEKWNELEKVIEINGQSIRNFIYTTEYLLKNATTISELYIKSIDEFRIWKELKRFSDRLSTKLKDDDYISGISISDINIVFEEDTILINKGSKEEKIKRDDFLKRPRAVIKKFISYKNLEG